MSCVSGYNLEKIQNEIRWLYTGQYLEWDKVVINWTVKLINA